MAGGKLWDTQQAGCARTTRVFPLSESPPRCPASSQSLAWVRMAKRPPQSAKPRGNLILLAPPTRCSRHVLPFGTVPPWQTQKRGRGGSEETSPATRSGSGSSWRRQREAGTSLPPLLLSTRVAAWAGSCPGVGHNPPALPLHGEPSIPWAFLTQVQPPLAPSPCVQLLTKPQLL